MHAHTHTADRMVAARARRDKAAASNSCNSTPGDVHVHIHEPPALPPPSEAAPDFASPILSRSRPGEHDSLSLSTITFPAANSTPSWHPPRGYAAFGAPVRSPFRGRPRVDSRDQNNQHPLRTIQHSKDSLILGTDRSYSTRDQECGDCGAGGWKCRSVAVVAVLIHLKSVCLSLGRLDDGAASERIRSGPNQQTGATSSSGMGVWTPCRRVHAAVYVQPRRLARSSRFRPVRLAVGACVCGVWFRVVERTSNLTYRILFVVSGRLIRSGASTRAGAGVGAVEQSSRTTAMYRRCSWIRATRDEGPLALGRWGSFLLGPLSHACWGSFAVEVGRYAHGRKLRTKVWEFRRAPRVQKLMLRSFLSATFFMGASSS